MLYILKPIGKYLQFTNLPINKPCKRFCKFPDSVFLAGSPSGGAPPAGLSASADDMRSFSSAKCNSSMAGRQAGSRQAGAGAGRRSGRARAAGAGAGRQRAAACVRGLCHVCARVCYPPSFFVKHAHTRAGTRASTSTNAAASGAPYGTTPPASTARRPAPPKTRP